MRVELDISGFLEGPVELVCSDCGTVFMSSSGPIELDHITLVGIIQTHDLDCPGEKIRDEHLYHDLCGTQLFHFRGKPTIRRCEFCNRTISDAETIRHELKWVTRTSYHFKPGCCCGWVSTVSHILEKDASAEFKRHPKLAPSKPRRVQ